MPVVTSFWLARRKSLLVAAPVLTLSVVLAGLAMSITWRLLVAPVDVDGPERVVLVRMNGPSGGPRIFRVREYETMAMAGGLLSVFESTAAIGYQTVTVDAGRGPTRAALGFVTPRFFDVLGRAVRHGRGFDSDDFRDGAAPVAVLTDRFWRDDLMAANVLGREIAIGGAAVTVIGIAAPGVIGTHLDAIPAAFLPLPQVETAILHTVGLLPGTADPLGLLPGTADRAMLEVGWLEILARVSPADSLQTAARRVQAGLDGGGAEVPGTLGADLQASLLPLRDAVVPFTSRVELVGSTRLFLTSSLAFLLLGATTFGMVALLHLESRRGELSMRLVLGANRWRIAAMACAEVLAMVLIAVALAFPVAAVAIHLLRHVLLPGHISVASLGLMLDGPTALLIGLAGVLAIAFVSALVGFGVAGYLRERIPIGLNLAGTATIAPRLRRGLVTVLLSLAIVLIGGAVFASRTVSRILAVDLKHEADRVLYVRYALAEYGYTDVQAEQFADSLIARAVQSPAVHRGSVHFRTGGFRDVLYFDGQQQDYPGLFPFWVVGPAYLDTLGLRPIAGRSFTAGDRAGQPPVAVITASVAEMLAERNGLAGLDDVIGRTLMTPSTNLVTIVGVVENWVYSPQDVTGRSIYILAAQNPVLDYLKNLGHPGHVGNPTFVFHVDDPETAKRAVLAANRDVDPRVVPLSLQTTAEAFQSTYVLQYLVSRVMTVFSLVGLGLACLSLCVLVRSIGLAKRKELAIRAALGAQTRRLACWFAAEIARPLLVAVPVGAAALWLWFSLMSTYVAGLTVDDLGPVLLVLSVAIGSAIAIAIGPATWASRRVPARVLREE